MSRIYLAACGATFPPPIEESVALKIASVDPEHRRFYLDTLDNEVEHLRRLRHRGIVRLYRIEGQGLPQNPIYSAQTSLPDRPWFSVMEFLAGGSLAELLKRRRRLDVRLALEIASRLAEALAYIHNQGSIHLDIKPENVVFRRPIEEGAEPVLVDFGIARAQGQEGLEAGTLQWSPPERIINSERNNLPPERIAKPHPSMDVYALGLLLYRMVAGRLPFEGSRAHVTSAILQGNPTRPSVYVRALDADIDRIVLAAIAKDPAKRPTASQLAWMLDTAAAKRRTQTPPSPRAQAGQWTRRAVQRTGTRLATLVVGIALLVALLAGWWWGRGAVASVAATPTPTVTATVRPAIATRRAVTQPAPLARTATAMPAMPTRNPAAPEQTSTPAATRTSSP